ncbi:MAG: hypothetical protein M1840_007701 [Geoglossum simile]|nr:MAG: hypothetical protein M1840_007701 [Geoglossum simile]
MKRTTVTLATLLAWSSTVSSEVLFDKNLIPNITGILPFLSLGKPVSMPDDILGKIIQIAANGSKVDEKRDQWGVTYLDGGRLVGYIDGSTGETSIFPKFEALNPASNIPTDRIRDYFEDQRIFPIDDTKISFYAGPVLSGSTHYNNSKATDPMPYLADIRFNRTIAHEGGAYPVCGPGSQASFGFAGDGLVHSLTHFWHPAKRTDSTSKPLPVDNIYKSIVQQLEAGGSGADVTVKSVHMCFYDSGHQYMQPVFQFQATTNSGNDDRGKGLSGFVPATGLTLEAIPDLIPKAPGAAPGGDTKDSTPNPALHRRQSGKLPIKVARYIYRNPIAGERPLFIQEANDFWNGLQSVSSSGFSFIDSQYFWAQDWQYLSLRDERVNSVNLAMTDGHGNWGRFWTSSEESVHINDIPIPAYGGKNRLAYWLISACEVIPTPTDYPGLPTSKAFTIWWHIFNGLHAVLGYRTEAGFIDGSLPGFSRAMARGASVVPAWLKVVHELPVYNPSSMYFDKNRDMDEPWGRPSAVNVCGHADDTLAQGDDIGTPGCLQMWWYNN